MMLREYSLVPHQRTEGDPRMSQIIVWLKTLLDDFRLHNLTEAINMVHNYWRLLVMSGTCTRSMW